jgi:hypothetical protein
MLYYYRNLPDYNIQSELIVETPDGFMNATSARKFGYKIPSNLVPDDGEGEVYDTTYATTSYGS